MKAWILHRIGDIRYEETKQPELLDNEVLIAVKAAGICGSDIPRIYKNGAHTTPLILGHEFSGEVVRIGRNVRKAWQGKRAGVFPLIPCMNCIPCQSRSYEMCRHYDYLGSRRNGAFAEYAAVPEWNLIELPQQVSYEEAAMLEPMSVAVHAMRRVRLKQSDTALVIGLGAIGQFLAMFLAERKIENIFVIGNKDFQKKSVVTTGISEENFCDSRTENVKDWVMDKTAGNGADVIFECVGRNDAIAQAIDLAAPAGELCMVGNPFSDIKLEKDVYWKILRSQLTISGTWNSSFTHSPEDDWNYVLKRLEQKRIAPEKLISHRYPIERLLSGFHMMRDKTEDYIKAMMTADGAGKRDGSQ